MNQDKLQDNRSPEEIAQEHVRRKKKEKHKKTWRVIDRIFGFFLATGIMIGIAGLLVLASIVGGTAIGLPEAKSPALRNSFIVTMLETRRFGFVSRIFLSEEELAEINEMRNTVTYEVMDPTLIHISTPEEQAQEPVTPETLEEQGKNPEQYIDEDGDGYILVPVKGKGYNGYMLIVLDPKRVYVAEGGEGVTINMMAQRTGAIGGINAGSFVDTDGTGSGRKPLGMTWINGTQVKAGNGPASFVGIDGDGILHVGYFRFSDAMEAGIVGGVTFGPPLVLNGVPQENLVSSINPRTAIGQREDGAILMLVVDGRQLSSAGCTYSDLVDIMMDFGAVNACNLDGGSSTVMYLNGELVNSPSSASGYSRGLPNAFMFR